MYSSRQTALLCQGCVVSLTLGNFIAKFKSQGDKFRAVDFMMLFIIIIF